MRPLPDVLWVGSTTIGLAAGGFVLHFPGSFGDSATWEAIAIVFGGILGAITGLGVGVIQWAALRLGRREGVRLLLLMAVAIGITHALFDGGPASIGLVAMSILAGLSVAVAYAIVFDHRRQAVLAGAGWAIGLTAANAASRWLGLPWEETPVGWSTDHAIQGLVVGLVWGTVTAAAGVVERLRVRETATRIAASPSSGTTTLMS
jgi:hypothetical protein